MAMLAWLMRGGWVTQLCTFAYVVVWPEIIYEVEHALEAQAIAKAKQAQGQGGEPASLESTITASSSSTGGGENHFTLPTTQHPGESSAERSLGASTDLESSTATLRDLSLASSQTEAADAELSSGSETSSVSPSSPSRTKHKSRPDDEAADHDDNDDQRKHHRHRRRTRRRAQPTAVEQAAENARLERIADKAARELADKATAHARKAPPTATAHPSVNDAPHLAGLSPHVILDAKKATGRESLYLDAIARRLLGREGAPVEGKKPSGDHQGGGGGGGGGDAERGEGAAAAADGADKDDAGKRAAGASTGAGGLLIGGAAGRTTKDAGASRDGKELEDRVAAAWPRFWKYFNGRSALERIALQEDMKRKEVWTLLTAMSEYLLTVRHW